MSKRWTHHEDMYIAQFFDIVGDKAGRDKGKPNGAAARRVKLLKDCGAWEILQKMLQDEFDNLSALLIAKREFSMLENLCMTHVKAPWDWEDRFGFVQYGTPEAREDHLNSLARYAGVVRVPEQATSGVAA